MENLQMIAGFTSSMIFVTSWFLHGFFMLVFYVRYEAGLARLRPA